MNRNTDRLAETQHADAAAQETAATHQSIRRKFLIGAPFAVAAALLVKQPDAAQAATLDSWLLTGNAISLNQFLGTTNAQPLNIRTNNVTRMTITSAGLIGVGTTTPASQLHVNTASGVGIRSDTSSANTGAAGVLGRSIAATGGAGSAGVRGEALSATSVGGLFRNLKGAGTAGTGVRGLSASGTETDTAGFFDGAGEFSGPNGIVASASSDSQYGYGVAAIARGTGGIGVYGTAYASSGYTSGVYGNSNSPTGTGVKGTAPNSISNALNAYGVQGYGTSGVQGQGEYMGVVGTSPNYGIFGYTNPDTGGTGCYGRGAYGVHGRSYTGTAVIGDTDSGIGVNGLAYSGGASTKAVYGKAYGSNSNGVVGEASNGGAAFGVWGISTTGYAGYFSGKVSVSGNLSKGGGSFKIDHPLDPANKYLYHSFVESPDMLNIYNGNVTLDASGKATVQLPAWFGALNRDYRYQLTPIGAPGPNLYISAEVKNNQFSIAGGTPNGKVSWQVTGIRQDAFANANRIPVEEVKPADERGTYLHAEAHGKPASMSTDFTRAQALAVSKPPRPNDPMPPTSAMTKAPQQGQK